MKPAPPAPSPRPGPAAELPSHLICRNGSSLGALPLEQVVETLRPLPVERLPEMPPFVLGLAMIRGAATPVLHLGRLLGSERDDPPGRFISLHSRGQRYALAVDEVLGLASIDASEHRQLPSLLSGCQGHGVEAIGTLDQALLLLLQGACLLPEPARWMAQPDTP